MRIWNAHANGMIYSENRTDFKKKKDYYEYKLKESNVTSENIMKIICSA